MPATVVAFASCRSEVVLTYWPGCHKDTDLNQELYIFCEKICSYVENLCLLYCAFTFCLRIKDTINKSNKTRANTAETHGWLNPKYCLLVDFLHMKLIIEQTPGILIINRPGVAGAVPEKIGNAPTPRLEEQAWLKSNNSLWGKII